MDWFAALLETYPETGVFLALGLGGLAGQLEFKRVVLGTVTGSLVMALAVGYFFHVPVPDTATSILSLLFLFGIGYSVGPAVFRTMRGDGWRRLVRGIDPEAQGRRVEAERGLARGNPGAVPAWRFPFFALSIAASIVLAACGPAAPPPTSPVASGEPREFTGTWNAAGSRRILPLGADRRGAIIHLRGTMLLAGPDRPGVGFSAELIALVDSATGLVGRSVWTDERGDQVYSELKGEGTAERNRITGSILGGTGRYAGATGAYEFAWRFVLEAEDGSIQGSTVGLKGRVVPGPGAGGPPS